jgi:V8-like Glu-specific endopeptidase
MNRLKLLLYIFPLVFLSCEIEDDILPDFETTFGIRHDKTLTQYENLVSGNNSELPDFEPVVFFEYAINGNDFVATGVLITPNWILTAGHNFFDKNDQSSPTPTEDINVIVGNDPNSPESILSVNQLVFHPTWINSSQDYIDANDLCLVKLASPYLGVAPANLFTSNTEVIGSTIWHSGFGDYTEQPGQDEALHPKKHAIENILDRKISGLNTSDGIDIYVGGLLAIDFDSPNQNVNSLGDDILNDEESLLGTGSSSLTATEFEGMAVPGDSGGPLFVKNGNAWEVAGILSGAVAEPFTGYKDWNYGGISIFIRVSSSLDWINEVIQ